MNQFNSQSKEIPQIIPETGIDSARLTELKKDVLRRSVDEHKESKELAEELKDLRPAVAALIIGIIMESFKPKEEDEEPKEESKKSVTSRSEAVAPPAKGEQVKAEPKKEPETIPQKTVTESFEMPNASDIVVIGDSIPKGMISEFQIGKRPDFIGRVGWSTPAILDDVRGNREKLKDKKTAIITCGGNDLVGTDDYEKVAGRIDKMVQECEKAGIEEIIVLTRFPYQADFKRTYIKERSRELRKVILKKFHEPRVKVIDLYKHFVDEKGDLKEQYASKGKDKLHPRKAYKDALRIIGRETGTDLESLMG